MPVPSSSICVCKGVPINNTYEHSLYFETWEAQSSYFLSKVDQFYGNYTYLRENHSIKVSANMAQAMTWNYLYYSNGDGRKFYNFIKRVSYVNEATVLLELELDVIQTFMFDWKMKQCFIERQHTNSDELYQHTIPEGLETGPLVDNAIDYVNMDEMVVMVMTTNNQAGNLGCGSIYDGIYSTLNVYAVNLTHYPDFSEWLDAQSETGKIDAIVAMWMYPRRLLQITKYDDEEPILKHIVLSQPSVHNCVNDFPTDFQGYTPKNKKLYTYPYMMMYVTNNEGGAAVYRPELFKTPGEHKFTLYGGLFPECGAMLIPHNYKDVAMNFDESLAHGAFPTCAWDSDTYKVWLAQNQNQHKLANTQAIIQAGTGVMMAMGGLAQQNISMGTAGLAIGFNALMQQQQLMAQKADMEIQPPQARGQISGNLNLAHGRCGYDIHFRTITAEYARRIDEYFTRYGYQVNMLDVPSLKNRENYTYNKTVGCLVTGNFGTEYQLKIQSIFDKGITFWVNPSYVGIYTISNNPL